MGAIYLLTLRQLSGRGRLVILAVLAAMPIGVALLSLHSSEAPGVPEFEALVLSAMLAGSIIPLVVLAIGIVAFGNELEDRTLANLTLTPLPRWRIALPKLLATITVAAPFVALSAAVTAHIAFLGDLRAILAVTVGALAAVALYAAAFNWLGLVSPQAIGLGLLYVVLWEGFLSRYVQGVRLLSLRYYAVALMNALDPRRFAEAEPMGLGLVLLLAAAVFGGFLWLTVRRLRRMDVP